MRMTRRPLLSNVRRATQGKRYLGSRMDRGKRPALAGFLWITSSRREPPAKAHDDWKAGKSSQHRKPLLTCPAVPAEWSEEDAILDLLDSGLLKFVRVDQSLACIGNGVGLKPFGIANGDETPKEFSGTPEEAIAWALAGLGRPIRTPM